MTTIRAHRCSQCGNLFEWGNESRWFGSWRQEDEPSKYGAPLKFCSKKCINAAIRDKKVPHNQSPTWKKKD